MAQAIVPIATAAWFELVKWLVTSPAREKAAAAAAEEEEIAEEVTDINIEQATLDKQYIRELMEREQKIFREESKEFKARQRAHAGATGATFEGSVLRTLEETERRIQEDYEAIATAGEHKISQIDLEIKELEKQGEMYEAMSETAKRKGIARSWETFLTSVGNVAYSGLQFGGMSPSKRKGSTTYFTPYSPWERNYWGY